MLSRSNIAGVRFEVARLEEMKKEGISRKLQEALEKLQQSEELLCIPEGLGYPVTSQPVKAAFRA